ncbi:helix-turn-helix domain-containing protein [Actinomycetospora termitidis]|uniref:Helix-turn-helix domain-containing protein n=1 Tax=Actinomycetospora termitidis TaxID=3053470 RepID=A0ABT7MC12_9PSEU|nr:helix-turn-helix domain-containing protein [Actinomycetospora sp. Odt1-22]MDL5158210.1 helix-turn-helix domain-containing protein [Actinomycetospora sp. Odt1-22]
MTTAGAMLKGWRTRRRRSQMDLALEANVSTRHLSFVETGKAQASRALLLDLATRLDVPLRERNVLLLAAGYAPSYGESALDDLSGVRDALEHLLAGHEPYPAVVVDRRGDVVLTNRAVALLLAGVDDAWLAPPINIYRLALHPDVLDVRNRAQWSAHLLHRLDRLVDLTGDPRLVALRDEVRPWVARDNADEHADRRSGPVLDRAAQLMLPLHLGHPEHGELRFYSTITHFGAAFDVTLDELSIESFVPADEHTRRVLTQPTAVPSAMPMP